MQPSALRQVLLDLFGTVRQPDLSRLNGADWAWIDRMAARRRLQALLHVQHRDNPGIPPDIAANWRAAYRESALLALPRMAELKECTALLEAAGLAPLALKGAWLAPHAYDEPAQRPMYDLDVLLTPETVLEGYALLKASGYTQAYAEEIPLEAMIGLDKHLPSLIAPRGSMIELHHHMADPDGTLDHPSPGFDEPALRARAVRIDGVSYPAPQDMLAHLIIHAAYSHRFDCGPRVLADIDFMLRRVSLDWAEFWRRASTEGWRDGARLVLELVIRNRAGVVVDFTADPGPPPPEAMIAGAVQLLFQEPDSCATAGFTASVLKGGWGGLLSRMRGSRSAGGEAPVVREMDSQGGRLGWAVSRLARVAGDLAQADIRRQSRELARLSRWFDR